MRRFALLFLIFTNLVGAEVISSYTSGTNLTIGTYGRGQSVLTPAGGPWTNITFCFTTSDTDYAGSPAEPRCWANFENDPRYPEWSPGQLFVLTEEYLGDMWGLSPATPGYLAVSSTMVDERWIFGSELRLDPLTLYYFYSDTIVSALEGGGPTMGYATFGGENLGNCSESLGCLFQPQGTNNYQLTGLAIPEPATGWLLGAGCLALLALRGRIRR